MTVIPEKKKPYKFLLIYMAEETYKTSLLYTSTRKSNNRYL